MFRRHQQLRRWALRVLLVWLFGLGLGVANACVAAQQFAGGGDTIQREVELQATDFAAPAGCEHHLVAAPSQSPHDPDASSPKSNCESFCERAGVTMPPQKSVLDNYQFHFLPPSMAALTVPASIDVSADVGAPRRDGARPLPIPIVFLRLAL
ncbi:MAG: hypothetical protein IV094_15255 [Vitreoscilla sp.]|nr:hypothetical protein [Vitreoscilla sp.]